MKYDFTFCQSKEDKNSMKEVLTSALTLLLSDQSLASAVVIVVNAQ